VCRRRFWVAESQSGLFDGEGHQLADFESHGCGRNSEESGKVMVGDRIFDGIKEITNAPQ